MKLKAEDLIVTSFETNAAVLRPITDPNDPTPDSRCFVCPVYSEDCY